MKVVFRADASLAIGSGHLMRCLTLADALRARGADCTFVCREHPGHCNALVHARGYAVRALPPPHGLTGVGEPRHAAWLGVDGFEDAAQTIVAINAGRPDWMVVDHYALDSSWERQLRPYVQHIMAIDDLADRPHDSDLLLDQNLGREAIDYADLVPAACTLLTGTRYALLRPEFAALREYSLQRRHSPQVRRLLITMGGVDQFDATGQVLDALQQCPLPEDCCITVVMGAHAPSLAKVRSQAMNLRWPCEVKVNANDMALLMAESDLAIGAAGSTSWERCALGLPTLVVVLAMNQYEVAMNLEKSGAATIVSLHEPGKGIKAALLGMSGALLEAQSHNAALLVDGNGTQRVVEVLNDRGGL